MTRKPDLSCADCARPMWSGKGALTQGLARCRDCRRARPTEPQRRRVVCRQCGIEFPARVSRSVYCTRRCANTANNAKRGRYGQTMVGPRKLRADRARQAPGLSETQRRNLLRNWKRQHRRCAYCPALADDSHGPTLSHDVRVAAVAAGYKAESVGPARKAAGLHSVIVYASDGNTVGAMWSTPGAGVLLSLSA